MLSSAHSTLAKRLLSHGKDLPPLLATQLPSNELDAELYDFIALSLRAYVNPWWSKITRYDKEFLPEITRALVHVVRSLEARLLTIDFVSLGLLDLPTIITTHYSDYRNAADKLSTSYASGGAASLPQLFHFIQPHMAVSADGVIDQEYFRQIIDLVLKHCLPPEDYSPDAERFIVREVILKILLNDIIPKVTQPWFIQKLILDHIIREHETSSLLKPPSPPQNGHGFSFHTFVVIVLSAIQSVSGACLAIIQGYKQAISTIKRVNQSTLQAPPQRSPPQLYIVPPASQTRPSDAGSEDEFNTRHIRSGTSSTINSISSSMSHTPLPPPPPLTQTNHVVHINYTQHLIDMLSEIFSLNNRFASTALLTFCAMLATATSHFLDRYLIYTLSAAFSPAFILNAIRAAKSTLFPNGYPGPVPPDPSPEEQAAIRARLINWRPKGAAAHLLPWLLGSDTSRTLNDALEPLNSPPCNVHLLVIILDRVICALFPELLGEASSL